MRYLLFALSAVWAAAALAEETPVAGRMLCQITHVRLVTPPGSTLHRTVTVNRDYASGMELNFDYHIEERGGLSLAMGTPDRPGDLISETFAWESFRGISPFAGSAEFRAAYSEASMGRHGINYKGSDQLYLRNCRNSRWEGLFVRPHVSGLFTQVLSLTCRPQVDAVGTILQRLAGLRAL